MLPILRRTTWLPLATALVAAAGCGDNSSDLGDDVGDDAGDDVGDDAGDDAPACAAATGAITDGAWDDRFTIAGATGHDGIAPAVFDFAEAPDGSIVAAGRFEWFGGAAVTPLLRYADGAWTPARTSWELPPPGDGFSAIAIGPEGDLALATSDSFGERDGEIWLDDGTGLASIGAYVGQVRTMAWLHGELWVAGRFTMDDGAAGVVHLAVWDGSGWAAPPGGPANDSVFELLVDGDDLYAAGAFTEIGGIAANKVVRYDGDWTAFDMPDGAIAVFGLAKGGPGELYAGGSLVELFGEATTGGLARWTGSAWEILGGGVATRSLPGVVTDVVVHDGVVDAIGCFTAVGGAYDDPGAVHVQNVARWSGTAWQALDDGTAPVQAPWFQPLVCGDEGPAAIFDVSQQRLAVAGDRLFVGGMSAGAGGALSQALIAYDTATSAWEPQGASGLGLGGSLDRVAASPDGCEVYGLGAVTHVAGEPVVAHLLEFRGDAWQPIVDDLHPYAFCPALAVSPTGEVSVGCLDTNDAGDSFGSVYRLVGDQLERLDVEWPGGVFTLAYDPDGQLWVGGGGETGFVATLDGTTATVRADDFSGAVAKLAIRGADDVYAAGYFAAKIAHWDGAAWTDLGQDVPGQIVSLGVDATSVYVSTYDLRDGAGALLLGQYDGTDWNELATPASGLTASPDFDFEQILAVDGGLLLAGPSELDDHSGRNLLLYRDGHFTAFGGGVGAMWVGGVALSADSVWVAGSIAQAGPSTSPVSSVGVARFVRN